MKCKIMCEWCGNTMKTVTSFEAVRDAQQRGEDICKICRRKVAKVDTYFENMKAKCNAQIDTAVKELKAEFKQTLQKGDFDGGENIQDMGSKDKASRR
jgi:hypothetical protein